MVFYFLPKYVKPQVLQPKPINKYYMGGTTSLSVLKKKELLKNLIDTAHAF